MTEAGPLLGQPYHGSRRKLGHRLSFTYTNGPTRLNAYISGILQLTMVPSGWTALQNTSSANAGFVDLSNNTCNYLGQSALAILSITGEVIIVVGDCQPDQGFVLRYGVNGAGPGVTAQSSPGSATFTAETKNIGGTFTAIASSPVVTVSSHPTVTSTNPSSRGQGALIQNITITGTGFVNGATAAFSGAGITVNSTTFNSATSLTANISIAAGATVGARDVTVTNPDTGSGTGTGIFTVNLGPTVTSASPNMGVQGATALSVDITGTDFSAGSWAPGDVTFSGTGITVNSTTFNSATSLTANISIAAGATVGARDVTVRNPADSGRGTGTSVFTVIVGTDTSAAAANATAGDPSVVLTATIDPSSGSVDAGTVTFTVKSGPTTIGTVASGTVAANVATADFPLTSVSAGTYTIEAAYSGAPGVAASDNSLQPPPDLTIAPGPLDHLVLAPATATVDAGVGQPYTAEGFDAFDNSLGVIHLIDHLHHRRRPLLHRSFMRSSMLAGDHTVTGTDATATGTATLTVSGVLGVMSASTYHALTPARILDTRNGTGGISGAIAEHSAQSFPVAGVGGVPANASAVTRKLDRDRPDQQRLPVPQPGRNRQPDQLDPELPGRR